MLAVAHQPTQSSVLLWLQAEQSDRGWRVEIRQEDDVAARLWALDDHRPDVSLRNLFWLQPNTRIWQVPVDGLEAGRWYAVWFVAPAGAPQPVEPAATFRTLPDSLADGFTVLLGSCYSEDRDVRVPIGPTTRALEYVPVALSRPFWTSAQKVRHAYVALRSLTTAGPLAVPQGRVSDAYRALCESGHRPDVKVLVGDQVYVDQPVYDFVLPWRSDGWIARHLSRTYYRSWSKLSWFLSHGANICITDDHEYWNDYPDIPALPTLWPALRYQSFRTRWEQRAKEFARAVQLPVIAEPLSLGDDLSFFIADTRIHRQPIDPGDSPLRGRIGAVAASLRARLPAWLARRSGAPAPREAAPALAERPSKFMDEPEFIRMLGWITGLECPGVLAIGQPLLTMAENWRAGTIPTDANLPHFDDQYSRLCRALTAAPHDIVVLSGDVHFWRVASMTLDRRDRETPTTLVEIISSPMARVFGAPGRFDADDVPIELSQFPYQWNSNYEYLDEDKVVGPAPVDYRSVDPETDRSEDNVMTLHFTRSDPVTSAVQVEITTHLLRRTDNSGRPQTRSTGPIVIH